MSSLENNESSYLVTVLAARQGQGILLFVSTGIAMLPARRTGIV